MSEKTITVESYNPLEIYGANDHNLEIIRNYFPKLRIIARGNMLKLIGDKADITAFENKFNLLLLHYENFGKISEHDVNQLMETDSSSSILGREMSDDILVHGRNGMLIKAKTINQRRMVESTDANDLIFAIGPAGTGKTYTAVALAVRALKNKEIKRIILTRPAVEAGENLGFLPGDLRDKLDPYLQPLYDALRDMIPTQKLLTYLEEGTIEIAPLAFMRGRTLDSVFAILDEAQNATKNQIKMFLTRMGRSAKFIVTGDITQIDLPSNQPSGLIHASKILKNLPGIDFIWLDEKDIIRHKLVGKILERYSREDEEKAEAKAKAERKKV